MIAIDTIRAVFLKRMTRPPKRGIVMIGTITSAHSKGIIIYDLPPHTRGVIFSDSRLNKITYIAINPRAINIIVDNITIPRQKCSLLPIIMKRLNRRQPSGEKATLRNRPANIKIDRRNTNKNVSDAWIKRIGEKPRQTDKKAIKLPFQ